MNLPKILTHFTLISALRRRVAALKRYRKQRLILSFIGLILFVGIFSTWLVLYHQPNKTLVQPPASISGKYKPPAPSLLSVFSSVKAAIFKTKATATTANIHTNIIATTFYIGEGASSDNDYIANDQSAWDASWQIHYGGVDDPHNRNKFWPGAFTPKENPFYVALPYADFDSQGLKASAKAIPWYQPTVGDKSVVKNHWVKVNYKDQTCFGQWEDVGPAETDDFDYVFGSGRPKNIFGLKAGIDLSPAMKDCLKGASSFVVSWQFVDANTVPNGPWKEIVTASGLSW